MKKLLISMQFMILLLLFGRSNIFASEIKTQLQLNLKYDDTYDITQNSSYEGYEIEKIENGIARSYQVANGRVMPQMDTNVITAIDSTKMKATGVGTALAVLKNPNDLDDKIFVPISVEPAPLTYILVAGQSNAAGFQTENKYRPQDSVACAEDQIYSTTASFEPGEKNGINGTRDLTGVTFSESVTADNAEKFVPGSLTGERNIYGEELEYKTDHLAMDQGGKCGPDSGIAYEWNKLTGDKVWIINTAVGATGIQAWTPGGRYYENTKAFCQYTNKTYDAEIEARHYTKGKKLLFWLQGENDKNMDAADYTGYFMQMFKGMQSDIGIEKLGIIMVRSSGSGQHTNKLDLTMTGPRITQYYTGQSTKYGDIYVASNANENWVTDEGVSSYFNNAYKTGNLDYPLRAGISTELPATVKQVHNDIHYSQIAHNENGITAAYGMYEALYQNAKADSVSWVTKAGLAEENDAKTGYPIVEMDGSDNNFIMPKTNPSYTKGTVSVTGDAFTYDEATGTIQVNKNGVGYLTYTVAGKQISKIEIDVTGDLTSVVGKGYNGIYNYGGTYYYLKNSIIQRDVTTLIKWEDKWWYVEDGHVNFNYNSLVYYNGKWWYVHDGYVDFGADTLVPYNGNWWYVKGGYVRFDETTVSKLGDTWWYVKSGEVDFDANTLAEYNGRMWYIDEGSINFDATLIYEYSGKKYYVEKGVVDNSKNGLVECDDDIWYVRSGIVDTGMNTLVKSKGTWWYVKGGKVAENETTLVKYSGNWWYIKNGKIDFSARTLCKYNGNWFFVSSGMVDFRSQTLVKYNGTWWYVRGGYVRFNETTLVKYNGSWFYVKGGAVDFKATTLVKYNGNWFYVKNGAVNFKTTTLVKYNGTWFYVKGGYVRFNETTLCAYNGNWFYVKNGVVNFSATTLVKYNGNWFYVRGGYVRFSGATLCKYNGSWFYVKGGYVRFNEETLCLYNGVWYYVNSGVVNFAANKKVNYNGGTYNVQNGIVVFN